MDPGAVIGITIGLIGLAGTVFTALSWRRSDTSAAVTTQSTVLGDMAGLNDELRKAVAECRSDRDRLAGENEAMRRELRRQLPPDSPPKNGDATVLVARGVAAIEEQHRSNRKRFLWTWLALGCLAMLCGFGVAVGLTNAHNRQEDIQVRAQEAKQQGDDILGYLKGDNGLPGVPGANGVNGSPGKPGGQGPAGPAGPAGPKGDRGPTGKTGTTGSAGASGSPGAQGGPGPQGGPGSPGEAGSEGATGAKGERGPTGPTGKTGAAGPVGPAGPPGPTGPQGAPGGACPAGTTPTQVAANDVNGRPVVVAACAIP